MRINLIDIRKILYKIIKRHACHYRTGMDHHRFLEIIVIHSMMQHQEHLFCRFCIILAVTLNGMFIDCSCNRAFLFIAKHIK